MIYIFTLFVCVLCSIYYDVMNKRYKRKFVYKGLLIWFIAVSALQYMMGTDMVYYVEWYNELSLRNWSIKDLISDNKQYQPGWLALGYFCRVFTEDYLLLKILQATFVNISVFSFFKRETKYIFTAVCLYALMSYLVVNFNLMRQSIALGFSLYCFTYLRKKDYIRYYIFVFLAYLFHNSALVLIPLPLLTYVRFTKVYIYALIAFFMVAVFILPRLNLEGIMFSILQSGTLGGDISELGATYMSRDRLGVQSHFAIFSLQRLFIVIVVLSYVLKYKDPYYGALGVIYILFQILSGFLPVLWRFRLYLDFSYYVLLANCLIMFSKSNNRVKTTMVFAVMFFLIIYFPVRDYLSPVEKSKYRNIDQYYPYHSVFDKVHDQKKQNFFDSLTL